MTIDHRIMGGVPCVAGTRIPVTTVVGLLGQGETIEDVLADYPTLTRDGILAALRNAARRPPRHVILGFVVWIDLKPYDEAQDRGGLVLSAPVRAVSPLWTKMPALAP